MNRRKYANPPILEAGLRVVFQSASPIDHVEEVLAALPNAYSGKREERVSKGRLRPERIISGRSISLETRTAFFGSESGSRAIGFDDASVTLLVRNPYPGWETLLALLRESIAALPRVVQRDTLYAVALQYRDEFILPPGAEINTFLTIASPKPSGLLSARSESRRILSVDEPVGTQAQLDFGAEALDDSAGVRVRLEISVSDQRDHGDSVAERWENVANQLHQRQSKIFESTITDNARGLFG